MLKRTVYPLAVALALVGTLAPTPSEAQSPQGGQRRVLITNDNGIEDPKLVALARNRKTPLVLRPVQGDLPSGLAHLRLEARRVQWEGTGQGHGRLTNRKQVFEASETVHYGRIGSDQELRRLMYDVIRLAKPPILSRAWEEAWGNLFSLLIEYTLASGDGPEKIIELLYGEESMPDVSGETILCINPGSTSTKVALYRGLYLRASDEVHLPPDFEDGIEARAGAIAQWLEKQGLREGELTGIACRGGFVEAVPSGTYEVVKEMVDDLAEPRIAINFLQIWY